MTALPSPAEYASLLGHSRIAAAGLIRDLGGDINAARRAIARAAEAHHRAVEAADRGGITRAEAARILATLPPDPPRVIARRRHELTIATRPGATS